MYLSVLQHPTKYQAKILTGKFCSWRKTKYPLGDRAYFWFILGHNSPTPEASRLIKVSKDPELLLDHCKRQTKWLPFVRLSQDPRTLFEFVRPNSRLHPLISPQNTQKSLFWVICVEMCSSDFGEAQKLIEGLKGMRGMSFLIFHVKISRAYGKCTNMDFSQKSQMWRCIFAAFIGFLAVSRIQDCFHWLSSPIRSGVMADHTFAGHCSVLRGR